MKHQHILCPIILLFAVSFSYTQNISIEDFRIPESQYKNLLVGLNGSLNSYSNGGDPVQISSSDGKSLDFRLSNIFGYNSENHSCLFNAYTNGYYSSSENEYVDYFSKRYVRNSDNNSFNAGYSLQYLTYITPDQMYWYVNTQGQGTYRLYREDEDTNGVASYNSFDKRRDYNIAGGGGVGYGKVRNARSVFAVVRIIEKLSEGGFLSREMTREEIISLVQMFEKRLVDKYEHDRPAKYLLRDLFDELMNRGVMTSQNAVAYAVSRTDEIFSESIYPRIFGWTVQTGIELNRQGQEYSFTGAPHLMNQERGNDWVIQAEFGYPVSLNLHWYNHGRVAVPVYGKQNRVDQYVTSQLYYEIGENISTQFDISYTKGNSYREGRLTLAGFTFNTYLSSGAEFYYYIEDALSFNLSATYYDYLTRTEQTALQTRMINDRFNVSFGLNYRIF